MRAIRSRRSIEQLIAWLGDVRLLVLLTKADKLGRSARMSLLGESAPDVSPSTR